MRKRAFTLIEILVAVAIFSIAMIISAGIFSNIIGNQSFVSVSSNANREGQRILRQISDDTVNATGTGGVSFDPSIQAKGILFLDSNNAVVTPPADCLSAMASNCYFPGIVLFSPRGIKIYRFNAKNKTLEYGVNVGETNHNLLLMNPLTVPNQISSVYTFSKLNSDNTEIISNGFSGISCYNSSCSQQPFIKIDMTTETFDYANKAARHRAKIELRTMITGRSY